MAVQRVELRKVIGTTPNLFFDPVVSTDVSLPFGSYSFLINMSETGEFKYYTVSYDVAGNISSVSSVVTVNVEKKK
ncbi:MAG: hypothetical protein P9L95_02570 [Candidatus Tenebribacter mawsonii]|nr:hypothetical protein [Candidatus Tenebribacter mawsonii]